LTRGDAEASLWGVSTSRYSSLLVFDRASAELARVLVDARCSFVSADGQYYFAMLKEPSGTSAEAARFATAVLVEPGAGSSSSTIDLGAGRVPGTVAALINPIQLLQWLVAQPAAVDFYPTLHAYLGSSDPDDILPYLPFHPAIGNGSEGTSAVVAVRVRHACADHGSEVAGRFRIAGVELQLPGGLLGA
jgi:hypothetical protein